MSGETLPRTPRMFPVLSLSAVLPAWEGRMSRPLLLDLFCGAGGAAVGYHRAGFDVIGVDNRPQPNYPFFFVQGDALNPPFDLAKFDAIHASPPCQAYSISKNNGCHKDAPRLTSETRAVLWAAEKPYVIENVLGAPLAFPFMLCGASFGLGASGFDLARHRYFECSHLILGPPPCRHRRGRTIGVYGHGTNSYHREKFGRCIREQEKRDAMGIDWMSRQELNQAIPPAYTEWIGHRLMKAAGIGGER